jgi:O-antigen/teichoic acid export membrane protein
MVEAGLPGLPQALIKRVTRRNAAAEKNNILFEGLTRFSLLGVSCVCVFLFVYYIRSQIGHLE